MRHSFPHVPLPSTTMFSKLSSKLIHSGMFPSSCGLQRAQLPPAATSYFYLPVDEDEPEEPDPDPGVRKTLAWVDPERLESDESGFDSSSASTSSSSLASDFDRSQPPPRPNTKNLAVIQEILAHDDLYQILGLSRKAPFDRLSLRRAYLARSKACHPE